jgi:hypothetical protein
MARFIASPGFRPRPGQLVQGMAGKRLITGTVVADPQRPDRPKIRQVGWGCVLLFVDVGGKEVGINEVRPAEQPVAS